METISATQDGSSGANPSSVKSDDSSGANPSSVKSDDSDSPSPNCVICLGACCDKSCIDSCLHQFCFKCILKWSKEKAECPLCKQNFRSIIHNVRSDHQYEEYMVGQRQTDEVADRIDIDSHTVTGWFCYGNSSSYPTLTQRHHEHFGNQMLMLRYPMMTCPYPLPPLACFNPPQPRRMQRQALGAAAARLFQPVPGLYVHADALQYHLSSPEFHEEIRRYFGDRTEHFLHELYCFASTPYDMTGYDRNVQYTTDSRISTVMNEVRS